MAKPNREWNPNLVGDYDRIAELYAEAYADDLSRAPFDQDILNRFVKHVEGPVCDLGCGPGYVAAYLRQKGIAAFGIDLSPRMIEVAKRRYPEMSFLIGDMRMLALSDGVLEGVVSFYSIIHFPPTAVTPVFREMARVLTRNGRIVVGCHKGQAPIHADVRFGQPVSLDATLFEPQGLADYATEAGFKIEEILTRSPYEFEIQLEKIYLLGVKLS